MIITTGAVIAALLGIPSLFMGLFAAVQVITGDKLIAGSLGVLWAYLSVTGSYELNRRKFDWDRGRQYSDRHLLAGTIAVSAGLAISGAMHETMPGLALVPALSAVIQATLQLLDDLEDEEFLVLLVPGVVHESRGLGEDGDAVLRRGL